ncbi:hypothetical protein [Pseudarthrobacter sp. LT1]|uniref:putative phage holin n=1 Tax=Pseudarthrobacter sp. LT1 TaxID=3111450 RepID=UPI002D79BE50|nr:hypothetical protein [Pseudarthrobacter sp. LT1]WRT14648.1 hypothetical protein VIK36_03910 [Pseudarthrobacter sp. LT1]
MTLIPLNAAVIGLVGLVTIGLMVYWHRSTRGSWKLWPAGRSLMTLLGVIVIITVNAAVNVLLPRYPGKVELYFGLYLLLLGALIHIGYTIRAEMRAGKARQMQKSKRGTTGPVTVVVATENKETPDDKTS